MALTITHKFISPKVEQSDPTLVGPNEWNNTHLAIDTSQQYVQPLDCVFTPQNPGVALIGGITNTITLTPVPIGVNGFDFRHYLCIHSGSNHEAVLITGGTAVSGAPSGTVTFVPVNSYPANSYTIETATAGIQEALVFARANSYNVISRGGPMVWNICGTITILAQQDWTVDIQCSVLNWVGSHAALDPMVSIDSQINSTILLGILSYSGSGRCIELKPATIPGDPSVTISDSVISINAIASAAGMGPNTVGMALDCSIGSITWNTIIVYSMGSFPTGFAIPQAPHTANYNWIKTEHIQCPGAGGSIGIETGTNESINHWYVGIDGASNASAVGINTGGANDVWEMSVSNFPTKGNGLILSPGAIGNHFRVKWLSGYYTNNSVNTNRMTVISMDPASLNYLNLGYAMTTPTFPASGTAYQNTTLTPIIADILGSSAGYSFVIHDQAGDPGNPIPLIAGAQIRLDPGESFTPTYTGGAPGWKLRALSL